MEEETIIRWKREPTVPGEHPRYRYWCDGGEFSDPICTIASALPRHATYQGIEKEVGGDDRAGRGSKEFRVQSDFEEGTDEVWVSLPTDFHGMAIKAVLEVVETGIWEDRQIWFEEEPPIQIVAALLLANHESAVAALKRSSELLESIVYKERFRDATKLFETRLADKGRRPVTDTEAPSVSVSESVGWAVETLGYAIQAQEVQAEDAEHGSKVREEGLRRMLVEIRDILREGFLELDGEG